MNVPKTAVVLGGTRDHSVVLESLRARDFQTILIDYYDDPPARLTADVHVVASALDSVAVADVAKHFDAEVVISVCVDQAMAIACEVSEQLGLHAPMTASQALDVTDKARMKRLMADAAIATPDCKVLTRDSGIPLTDPARTAIVKPADCNGSLGIRKTHDIVELAAAVKAAQEFSRTGTAIVEDFVEGTEFSLDCWISGGTPTILLAGRLLKKWVDGRPVICGWRHATDIPPAIASSFLQSVTQICDAFQLVDGPLLVQAVVDPSGNTSVIEFSPRVGGGSKYLLLAAVTGIAMIDHAVDAWLGSTATPLLTLTNRRVEQRFLYARPGAVSGTPRISVSETPATTATVIVDAPGSTQFQGGLASRDRVGSIIVDVTSESARGNALERTLASAQLFDKDGQDLLRHDLLTGPFE